MDRVVAARERLEAGKAVALQAREAGPPCSDCRYRTLLAMCGNPAYAEMRFDPAKGRLSEIFNTNIEVARSDEGVCGPEAILFEPQITPVAVGKAAVRGGWLAARLISFGAAAILFVAWLLR